LSDGEVNATSRGLEFAPPPASFPVPAIDTSGLDLRSFSSDGVAVILSEAQADLTGRERVSTTRLVRAVTGHDGLQSVARFDPVFDPRFERLVIHGVRVIRNGVARDEGRPEAFEMMRRELNLERAIYDGRVTAHMIIPDLREGDIVDCCYSVTGEQPSLRGAFSWFFILQWSTRTVETICRVIARPDQKMLMRRYAGAPAPRVGDSNGRRIYTWRVRGGDPYLPEPFAPAWSVGFKAVEIGFARSWAQIADLFRDMYEGAISDGSPPTELAAEVEAICARTSDAAARVVEGLRLVQQTLRYHAVAIGEGGFRPRALRTIWSTRYGDCKDASVLLTSVLRQMGLEASCALVNVGQGADLHNFIPSPRAFNHCIVRLRLNGRDYWLDGTRPPQSGDLAHLTQARFGWALPMIPDATLVAIEPPPLTVIREVVERWTFPRDAARAARLDCSTTSRSWRADETRRLVENRDLSALADLYRDQLERDLNSNLREISPMAVEDSASANSVTLRESYEVERAMVPISSDRRRFVSFDDIVRPNLPIIDAGPRREPIALGERRRAMTHREFSFPSTVYFPPWDETIRGPGGLEARVSFAWLDRRRGAHTVSLTVPTEVLAPDQAGAYRTFLERVFNQGAVAFDLRIRNGRLVDAAGGGQTPWGAIASCVVITLLVAARCAGGG